MAPCLRNGRAGCPQPAAHALGRPTRRDRDIAPYLRREESSRSLAATGGADRMQTGRVGSGSPDQSRPSPGQSAFPVNARAQGRQDAARRSRNQRGLGELISHLPHPFHFTAGTPQRRGRPQNSPHHHQYFAREPGRSRRENRPQRHRGTEKENEESELERVVVAEVFRTENRVRSEIPPFLLFLCALCDLRGYVAGNADVFSASLRLSGIHCPGNALKAGAGRGVWLAAKERKDHKEENRPSIGRR